MSLRGYCSRYDRSELIAQWHCSKKRELKPSQVPCGSAGRVWQRCTDGHEWKAVICSRTGAKKIRLPGLHRTALPEDREINQLIIAVRKKRIDSAYQTINRR